MPGLSLSCSSLAVCLAAALFPPCADSQPPCLGQCSRVVAGLPALVAVCRELWLACRRCLLADRVRPRMSSPDRLTRRPFTLRVASRPSDLTSSADSSRAPGFLVPGLSQSCFCLGLPCSRLSGDSRPPCLGLFPRVVAGLPASFAVGREPRRSARSAYSPAYAGLARLTRTPCPVALTSRPSGLTSSTDAGVREAPGALPVPVLPLPRGSLAHASATTCGRLALAWWRACPRRSRSAESRPQRARDAYSPARCGPASHRPTG